MTEGNNKVKEALRLVEKDWKKISRVLALDALGERECEFQFKYDRIIGNGSFGIVCAITDVQANETLALKKVFQDRGYQNRELQIMKSLSHPNIVKLSRYFYSKDESVNFFQFENEGVYLNLVLEYVPSTVYRTIRSYTKNRQLMPVFQAKLCKSLEYIHSLEICHRDIKPQNLLVDPESGMLKLCDFGSAKRLVPGEENVSYICSRYYRAPEVIFGSSHYTTKIDIWSAGCVLAEMFLGRPVFVGKSSVDQLVEIIKVLGTPTKDQMESMNQNYSEYQFPDIKAQPLSKIFPPRITPDAIDLLSRLLNYNPSVRVSAMEALGHGFFDELKLPGAKLTSGFPLPPHLTDG